MLQDHVLLGVDLSEELLIIVLALEVEGLGLIGGEKGTDSEG